VKTTRQCECVCPSSRKKWTTFIRKCFSLTFSPGLITGRRCNCRRRPSFRRHLRFNRRPPRPLRPDPWPRWRPLLLPHIRHPPWRLWCCPRSRSRRQPRRPWQPLSRQPAAAKTKTTSSTWRRRRWKPEASTGKFRRRQRRLLTSRFVCARSATWPLPTRSS